MPMWLSPFVLLTIELNILCGLLCRWLNSSSLAFADKQGQPLTLREAICEHVFPLVDAPDREVRLKVGGTGGREAARPGAVQKRALLPSIRTQRMEKRLLVSRGAA